MLGTSYQKQERARRRHKARMEAIYAKRDDICRNCSFFKDGRFCVNPHHAEGNCWADQNHVVGSIMVTATQGCDLFERRREIDVVRQAHLTTVANQRTVLFHKVGSSVTDQ